MIKDEHDWLDALAGRADPTADRQTNRHAAALRAAMLAEREQELADASRDEGLDRLLFRLRREGLLEKERKPWLKGYPAMFAMAATLLLAVGVGWMVMTKQRAVAPGESNAEQAATHGTAPQVLLADDPDALAATLKQDFAAAGIALEQQEGAALRLQGELPDDLSADALQLLDRYRLALPPGRRLVIEIRQQPAQN